MRIVKSPKIFSRMLRPRTPIVCEIAKTTCTVGEPAQQVIHYHERTCKPSAFTYQLQHQIHHFRFLDLPTELQLLIIHFATKREQPIRVTDRLVMEPTITVLVQPHTRVLKYPQGISRVCRSLRQESLASFYKTNVFEGDFCDAETETELISWLLRMDSAHRRSVQLFVEDSEANAWGDNGIVCAEHFMATLRKHSAGLGSIEMIWVKDARFRLHFR